MQQVEQLKIDKTYLQQPTYLYLPSINCSSPKKIPRYHKNRVCSIKTLKFHIISVPRLKVRYQDFWMRHLSVNIVEIDFVHANAIPV